MKSLIILKDKNINRSGFTLVEVLVVLAIIAGIFIAGSFVDLSNLGRELLTTEQAILVSTFQKARNQSMNNINHTEHGVHIDNDAYIIFEGSYIQGGENNEKIPKNNNITITTEPANLNNFIFDQLSGNTDNIYKIILSHETRSKTIIILENGLIDW